MVGANLGPTSDKSESTRTRVVGRWNEVFRRNWATIPLPVWSRLAYTLSIFDKVTQAKRRRESNLPSIRGAKFSQASIDGLACVTERFRKYSSGIFRIHAGIVFPAILCLLREICRPSDSEPNETFWPVGR